MTLDKGFRRAVGEVRRSCAVVFAAMIVGLVLSAAAQAAPGDLDPTFSADGLQTTAFPAGEAWANALAIQPDGKIVVVGRASVLTGGQIRLVRYNPNGTYDHSFGGGGSAGAQFGSGVQASDVAIQPDGKIVAVGRSGGDFAVARFNRNGSLDKSFSGDGRQLTPFAVGGAGARGLRIQSNGKIVVAGYAGYKFAVARYNPNGTPDTTFSGDGRRVSPFLGNGSDLFDVAVLGSGKIVAVGRSDGEKFAVARYNGDGSPDTSFSGDGFQVTPFGDSATAYGAALAGGGPKIVVVGQSTVASSPAFALARYNQNGSLDTSFAGDGLQTTDFPAVYDRGANAVAVQGDGKIVVAGGAGLDFALARYEGG